MTLRINGVDQLPIGRLSPSGLQIDPIEVPGITAMIVVVKMDIVPPPAAGVNVATVGFQLQNVLGKDLALVRRVELGVFLKTARATPAPGATLTLVTGNIIFGAGGNVLEAESDTTGKFTVILTEIVDRTDVIICGATFGSPILDCTDTREIAFTA